MLPAPPHKKMSGDATARKCLNSPQLVFYLVSPLANEWASAKFDDDHRNRTTAAILKLYSARVLF